MNNHVWTITTRLIDAPRRGSHASEDVAEAYAIHDGPCRITSPRRTVAAIRPYANDASSANLSDFRGGNLIAEPADRGSAVSVMISLLHVIDRDPEAMVTLLPLGRGIADEKRLLDALPLAIAEAQRVSGSVVVLATPPRGLDCAGGWLVPHHDGKLQRSVTVATMAIDPDRAAAERFVQRGAHVSTDVLVASGRTLLGLFALTLPRSLGEAVCWRQAHGGSLRELRQLYARLQRHDLYTDFLERCADVLRLMPVATSRCCRAHADGPEPTRQWRDATGA